jgi:hypothetical protein
MKGVIYSEQNYEGYSRVFYPPGGSCVNLTPPLYVASYNGHMAYSLSY